jgi:hypothetical protein
MNPQAQEPKRVECDGYTGGSIEETHPAYAMIGASRVSGHARLFASEFNHQHYITISIRGASVRRDLSRDWHHADKEYIEVALSEAQWASFVSSMNMGDGVPCTLQHRNGAMIPQITGQVESKTSFKVELQKHLESVTKHLVALGNQINNAKLSEKAKKELQDSLYMATMNLNSNLPFVADSFSEHIETTVEKAKIEVNAHIQSVISRTGIETLKGQTVLQIEG